jgi:PAS domain S-box-containing protein
MLEKLQLTTKLTIGFGICIAVVVILGLSSIRAQQQMVAHTEAIYQKDLLGISHIKEANINLIYIGRALRAMILASTPEQRDKQKARMYKAMATLQMELDEAKKTIFRPANKKLVADFEGHYAQFKANVERATDMLSEQQYQSNEVADYTASEEFTRAVNTADETLTAISNAKSKGAEELFQETQKLAAESSNLTLLLIFLGVLIGLLAGLIIGRSITHPIHQVRGSIEGLADGKLDNDIPCIDYPNEMGIVARALANLQKVCRDMETQRWVKTHVADISAQIQQAENYPDLARRLLSNTCPLLGAGLGVLYIHEENQLRLLGSYGWRDRKHLNQTLELGEGLFGQSALEKRPITIQNPPEDYTKIGSALGEATPRVLAVLPIMHGGELLAMLELASFQLIGERETTLLDALLPVIAVTLEILGKNLTAQHMMKEAQLRADQMEKQAAQLEEASVEMDAQQSELLKTEEWYRCIVQAAESMLVIDASGIVVLCNIGAEAMFGYQAGELEGKRVESLLPSWTEASAAMQKLDAVRKDGQIFAIQIASTKLPDIGEKGACTCLSLLN